jgi:hypothetical protein
MIEYKLCTNCCSSGEVWNGEGHEECPICEGYTLVEVKPEKITTMNDIWSAHAGSFNSMTDAEIQTEVDDAQDKLDEAEDWLEAVASWIAAGRPRTGNILDES